MFRRCKICGKPAEEESQFCKPHLEQAQRLASSFGIQSEEGQSESVTAGTDDEPRAQKAKSKKKGKAKAQKAEAAPAKKTKDTAPPAETPETTKAKSQPRDAWDEEPVEEDTDTVHVAPSLITQLLVLLDQGQKVLRYKLKAAEGKSDKWPQLSAYYCGGELMVRPFFSVVPKAAAKRERAYPLGMVAELFKEKSPPAEAFIEAFKKHHQALFDREIHTLDMHFLDYAGGISINLTRANQKEECLESFVFENDAFVADGEDKLKEAKAHQRW